MATLQQIYQAYLANDPNVSQMTYDPFSWNIEQTFDDTTDEDTGGGTGGTGGITNVYTGGGDAAEDLFGGTNVRLPSSFQSTPLGYYGEEGTVGLPGDITQRGPGRELDQFEYKGKMYDDPLAPASLMGYEEDASWFKRLREGFMDNPLMQGVMTVANPFMAGAKSILEGIGQVLPVNERAILENEALGSGVALDNIGRIVRQEGIDYDDAANIFAGYNYAQIDEDTFEKRRKSIQNMSPDAYKKRLKAINAFEKKWRESKIKTSYIVDQKMRAKGKTPLPDQIAINKAKQDFQNIVSQAEDAPKTVVDTPHPGLYTPIHSADPPSGGGQAAADVAGGSWRDSPFQKGGRVKYGNGGIVDLL